MAQTFPTLTHLSTVKWNADSGAIISTFLRQNMATDTAYSLMHLCEGHLS